LTLNGEHGDTSAMQAALINAARWWRIPPSEEWALAVIS
jgi:hypothetical protein